MSKIGITLGVMVRETGVALERLGCRMQGSLTFKDPLTRHKDVMPIDSKWPVVSKGCFIAPTATISGDVAIGASSAVWYGAVVRGDLSRVQIGGNTNISHRAVIISDSEEKKVKIGDNVLVGQGATLGAATIEDGACIGMGATISDGVTIGAGSAVAAGSFVPPGTKVPEGQLFGGSPAVFIKALTAADATAHKEALARLAAAATLHSSEVGKTFAQIAEEKAEYGFAKAHEPTLEDEFGLLEGETAKVW